MRISNSKKITSHRQWRVLSPKLFAALDLLAVRLPSKGELRTQINTARELALEVKRVFEYGKDVGALAGPLLERIRECVLTIANAEPADLNELNLAGALLSVSLLRLLCDQPRPEQVIAKRIGGRPLGKIARKAAARILGRVLVVDDRREFRRLLRDELEQAGAHVEEASDGQVALQLLRDNTFELVLLDVQLPTMNGYEVLEAMKADANLRDIPVIMLSAGDPDVSHVARAIELGAEDYLARPYNSVLLSARVNASLEKYDLRAQALRKAEQLERVAKERDALLQNILPASVAETLHRVGHVDPVFYQNVTIVFTDFVGFSNSVSGQARTVLITRLHDYFSRFDDIMDAYGLEKLKTIGDSYMFAGGLPSAFESHAVDCVLACFALMQEVQRQRDEDNELSWDIRIGVHSGPVVAGVVGKKKYAYDIWGATVNLASRMESGGAMNQINVSGATHLQVSDFFDFEERGPLTTKDKKPEQMYFVRGVKADLRGATLAEAKVNFGRRYQKVYGKELASFPDLIYIPASALKVSAKGVRQ